MVNKEGYSMNSYLQRSHMLPKSPSVPDLHGSIRMRNLNMEVKKTMSPRLPTWLAHEKSQQSLESSSDPKYEERSTVFGSNASKNNNSGYVGRDDNNKENCDDNDENLSFIDLYGEEGVSKVTENDTTISNNYNVKNMIIENSTNNEINNKSQAMSKSVLLTSNDLFNESSFIGESSFHSYNSSLPSKTKISINDDGIYDQYGFKKYSKWISETTYNRWWDQYCIYCQRRKLKWRLLLEKHKIQAQSDLTPPKKFPERSEKLKRYVRKGIPSDWRGNAWWYFAKGDDLLQNNIGKYSSLVSEMEHIRKFSHGDEVKGNGQDKVYLNMEIIERDLYRTFPNNIHFQKDDNSEDSEPEMISALRRVLVAFSIYNPKIGYCQSMNFLAGLLLLFLEEEKAFWMLVIITTKYLPGVHDANLEGVNIDQGVLMLCIREYLPEIWKIIKPTCETAPTLNNQTHLKHKPFKNEFLFKLPPITLCTVSWFMSCFIGVVPIETTLRIWDCLFYEGSHFLFKISLAILKICEHEVLHKKFQRRIPGISTTGLGKYSKFNNSNDDENNSFSINTREDDSDIILFQMVQSLPKTLLDPNDLFERSIFKRTAKLNILEQDEIDRCRKYVMNHRRKYRDYMDLINMQRYDNEQEKSTTKNSVMNNDKENKRRNYVSSVTSNNDKASKYDVSMASSNESVMTAENLSEVLMRESYGFKRTLTNVNWNSLSLKGTVRQIRKKKDP